MENRGSEHGKLWHWLDERIGLKDLEKLARKKEIPVHPHSIWYYFGGMTLFLFMVQVLSGILLLLYYRPSATEAYESIQFLMTEVEFGWLIRSIHSWSANLMVFAMFIHLFSALLLTAYRAPRELTWLSGGGLLALTLGFGFTGYLLPWDQLAFWAVTIGSSIAASPSELTDALGITRYFDPGGTVREVLLGAHFIGEEALIRFYTLHIMVLPIVLSVILGVHFWRIRKDGGLARPASADPPVRTEGLAPSEAPTKTFGLMAVIRERTAATDQAVENTTPAWPRLFRIEAALTTIALLITVALSLWLDAPLKELANPEVPENPAKAPWYFLGLQELVSYSAFMGGMVIPGIVVVGLALIPYLDREEEDVGVWFSTRQGRRIAAVSAALGVLLSVGVLAFTVNFGWLRNWFPDIPQIVITFINPGTVYVLACAAWSVGLLRYTNSTRMAAIGLFTCFLVCFVILTYFATVHRGPNWGFYWSKADWPTTGH